ncbi:hypothetical protein OMR58_01635 (plasmid) [Erwinia sp. INIA-01]|uniref:hypothetical protein n=1 Tax=Erwinia sp. INIA01 TaxID=2991500 RepID=UPI002224C387|nr:hypothetical protein [Erwinia sp. INIA01]MCW1873144.1 hypothetical protein [Erwinia sp. INIA01]
MGSYKTPIDDLVSPKVIRAMDTDTFRGVAESDPAKIKIECDKLRQKNLALQAENNGLYRDNEYVSKGISGFVLKLAGVKLRAQPTGEKVKKTLWRKPLTYVRLLILTLIFFIMAGIFGARLDLTSVALVSSITLLLSLFANALFPHSRSDLMRVLRVTGDIGAVSLVYATLKGIDVLGLGQGIYLQVFLGVTYVLAAIKLIRDL